ncbi:hypothetical protein J6590_095234 [Homalodisca vitripennis]|nr:hypothetical protein J6590_099630 [Homalodisca vitripennis]KAG8299672.1 hypothetical protein J6590_095234 [Homalodisca vitripennis]
MRTWLPQNEISDPTTPDSCSVLIVGANDIAAGDNSSIFGLLEQRITARLSSSVLMSRPASSPRRVISILSEDPLWYAPPYACKEELLVRGLMRDGQDLEAGEPSTELGTGCRSTSNGDTSSTVADCCRVETAVNMPLVAPSLSALTPPAPTTHQHHRYAEVVINKPTGQSISPNTSIQIDHHQNNSVF